MKAPKVAPAYTLSQVAYRSQRHLLAERPRNGDPTTACLSRSQMQSPTALVGPHHFLHRSRVRVRNPAAALRFSVGEHWCWEAVSQAPCSLFVAVVQQVGVLTSRQGSPGPSRRDLGHVVRITPAARIGSSQAACFNLIPACLCALFDLSRPPLNITSCNAVMAA